MQNNILVYDDNCPLCSWYSSLFVKYKFLDAEGRKPFSELDTDLLVAINFERSKNEIPLLNTSTGEVLYGIDALLELLAQKWKWMKVVGNIRPVNMLLRKLYKFISYNRKVIVAKKCGAGKIDCSPDYNYRYRFAFIFFVWTLAYLLFSQTYFKIAAGFNLPYTSSIRFQTTLAVFFIINIMLLTLLKKSMIAEYLGQLGVSFLITSFILMLIVFIFSNKILLIALVCITLIVGCREYVRRMQYAGLLESRPFVAGVNIVSVFMLLFALGRI